MSNFPRTIPQSLSEARRVIPALQSRIAELEAALTPVTDEEVDIVSPDSIRIDGQMYGTNTPVIDLIERLARENAANRDLIKEQSKILLEIGNAPVNRLLKWGKTEKKINEMKRTVAALTDKLERAESLVHYAYKAGIIDLNNDDVTIDNEEVFKRAEKIHSVFARAALADLQEKKG